MTRRITRIRIPLCGKMLLSKEKHYYKMLYTLVRNGYKEERLSATPDNISKKHQFGIVWQTNKLADGIFEKTLHTTYDNNYFNDIISDIMEYNIDYVFPKNPEKEIDY
jgi:hypothetical protein